MSSEQVVEMRVRHQERTTLRITLTRKRSLVEKSRS